MASETKKLSLERRVREILRNASDVLTAWKLPTDFRWTKNGVVHGEPMPADFMGYVKKTGRVFFVECKEVERRRLPMGQAPGLSAFQLQAAVEAAREDVPYVVVWCRPKTERTLLWIVGPNPKEPSVAWPDDDEEAIHEEDELRDTLLRYLMEG